MTRAQALAVKAFGENFAGFWLIAREAGNRIGVSIDSFSDVKAHKFDVLLQVCIMRPKLGNHIDWACAAIKEVCGVSFTASEAASAVFAYHLTLGGGYATTEHHAEIFDLLQKLYNIIEPYEKTHIDV